MLTAATAPKERLLGTGIVIPGPFGKTGLSGRSSDLTGWETLDAYALFKSTLGGTIELSNDANAAALAESLTGAARGVSSYAYLYFGKGLGLGIVNDGRLIPGAFGNAGEVGHIPVLGPDGMVPLESLLSRMSIEARLGNGSLLDLEQLNKMFEQGDSGDLKNWMNQAADALGQAVLILENLLDPQTIILGGAMPAG